MRITNISTVMLAVAIALTGASASAATSVKAPHGQPAQANAVQRTIELTPNTKYVNVSQGEAVKFVSQGKTFAWTFDTFGTSPFPLSAVAPADFGSTNAVVYVNRNLLYTPGG